MPMANERDRAAGTTLRRRRTRAGLTLAETAERLIAAGACAWSR